MLLKPKKICYFLLLRALAFKSNDQLKIVFVSIVTEIYDVAYAKQFFIAFAKTVKLAMSDIDGNSSDISDVFSDINSLSLNDIEALELYFNKPEYTEQDLSKNMTKCSTEEMSRTQRVEDFPLPTMFTNIV